MASSVKSKIKGSKFCLCTILGIERHKCTRPVNHVQDKGVGEKNKCLSISLCINMREKINKSMIHCDFTVHPSTTMSSNPFPVAVTGLCRDAERPRPQQLIHTQHSEGSKNVSAILSFKNTDSHRFRHNCQCSSGEEGKKILNLFLPAIRPQAQLIL